MKTLKKQTVLSRKRQKAIAIAKDVLKRLKLDKIRLFSGSYITPFYKFPSFGSLQQQIDKAETNCEVCALGGLFLSSVRLYNEENCEDWKHGTDFDDLKDSLKKYFSISDLILIEGMFEGITFNYESLSRSRIEDDVNKYREETLKGHKKKSTKTQLEIILKEICENIIRNDGSFVVPYKTTE